MLIFGFVVAAVCLLAIGHSLISSLNNPVERAHFIYHSRGDLLLFGLIFIGALGLMLSGHILR